MFAIRNIIRTSQVAKNVQTRNMSIAIPARNKVSTGEKLFLAGCLVTAWLSVPAWVLVNIKHYRDKN